MGTCTVVAPGKAAGSPVTPRRHCCCSCSYNHSLPQRCCSSPLWDTHMGQGCSFVWGHSMSWADHRSWDWYRFDCRTVVGSWRGMWCSCHSHWSRYGCRVRHCPAPGRTSHSRHTEWIGWRWTCWGRSPCTCWWWAGSHHNSYNSPRWGWKAGRGRTPRGRRDGAHTLVRKGPLGRCW